MMNIEDIRGLFDEYEIDDALIPFIKNQLKFLFLINVIMLIILFFKLADLNIALTTILFSTISGLLVFFKLLSVLTLRNISKTYFFKNIFPLRITIPFDFFFLKKDQTAMVYIGWIWWIIICMREASNLNYYLIFILNSITLYFGAFCTFFLASHLYYFFAVKKHK